MEYLFLLINTLLVGALVWKVYHPSPDPFLHSISHTLDEINAKPLPRAQMRVPDSLASDSTFFCYYCGHQFPVSQMELVGRYQYCPDDGLRRQRMLNEQPPTPQ